MASQPSAIDPSTLQKHISELERADRSVDYISGFRAGVDTGYHYGMIEGYGEGMWDGCEEGTGVDEMADGSGSGSSGKASHGSGGEGEGREMSVRVVRDELR